MSALLETLGQVLNSGAVGQISRQIGSDEGTTGNALSAALPVLLGALSRNATRGDGAEKLLGALSRDHDGGILDNLDVFLQNPESGSGSGILRHMLGGRQPRVESSLSRSTGLDAGSIGKLLVTLAPIIMGALGKSRRQNNMNSRDLSDMLNTERASFERSQPQASNPLNQLLDVDGDADVDMADLMKGGLSSVLGNMLGK